ncbi:hypothetical protein DSO57_1036555 [Entomophthora muscae]|uniref:Uncharacterized protein n=1 Tax=Entomophthora muscae TaxID=34485 RepID=A0ACC2TA79_9FUNG|nr:hypothetical protein DSO57_1036555 [Entomophthora muscae]
MQPNFIIIILSATTQGLALPAEQHQLVRRQQGIGNDVGGLFKGIMQIVMSSMKLGMGGMM